MINTRTTIKSLPIKRTKEKSIQNVLKEEDISQAHSSCENTSGFVKLWSSFCLLLTTFSLSSRYSQRFLRSSIVFLCWLARSTRAACLFLREFSFFRLFLTTTRALFAFEIAFFPFCKPFRKFRNWFPNSTVASPTSEGSRDDMEPSVCSGLVCSSSTSILISFFSFVFMNPN